MYFALSKHILLSYWHYQDTYLINTGNRGLDIVLDYLAETDLMKIAYFNSLITKILHMFTNPKIWHRLLNHHLSQWS